MGSRDAILSLLLVGLISCSRSSGDQVTVPNGEPAQTERKPRAVEAPTDVVEKPAVRMVYRVAFEQIVEDRARKIARDLEAKLQAARPKPIAGTVALLAGGHGRIAITPAEGRDLQRLDTTFFAEFAEMITDIDCPDAHRERSMCMGPEPE